MENIYTLSNKLGIKPDTLYHKYHELFTAKLYDYTCGLTQDEIKILKNELKKEKTNERKN